MKKIIVLIVGVFVLLSCGNMYGVDINEDDYVLITNPGHYWVTERIIQAVENNEIEFTSDNAQKAFLNKLKAIMNMADNGKYTGAAKKVENDIKAHIEKYVVTYQQLLLDACDFQIMLFEKPDAYLAVYQNYANAPITEIPSLTKTVVARHKNDCERFFKVHMQDCDWAVMVLDD